MHLHPIGLLTHSLPRRGLLASLRRLVLGDRIKRAQVTDHGAFIRSVGRAWAVPMTLVFSSGALITLGQKQIGEIVAALQHHQTPNYVTVALLLITFVIVGGMDLTLLNSAVELRDARLRGVDPQADPYTKGARLRVWLVSFIESATFMNVAYQLDQPPSFARDWVGCLVAWAFIVARALVAPVCAMYLATLGKRAMVRREMYGNLLLTLGGTIQQILENLQFAADERLIEPLWRMQVLVDRASRAQTDEEMDRFDTELLASLATLRHLRERLAVPGSDSGDQSVLPGDAQHRGQGRAGPSSTGSMGDTTTSRQAPAPANAATPVSSAAAAMAVPRDVGTTGAMGIAVDRPEAPAVKWSRDKGELIEAWALGELEGVGVANTIGEPSPDGAAQPARGAR